MNDAQKGQSLVTVESAHAQLEGMLGIPADARGVVLFAHGSGSSRHSPRNNFVAQQLRDAGIGTLLFDLLTEEEDRVDRRTREHRFDIELLADRLAGATDWMMAQDERKGLPLGYFGASTGAAAALKATARKGDAIGAIVSRGGRPDLAGEALTQISVPTLLIVGGRDRQVIAMNRDAHSRLPGDKHEVSIVPDAGHLFEEPGKLEDVAELARDWFKRWFP